MRPADTVTTLFDGRLGVHYGFWWIADAAAPPSDAMAGFAGQANGLLGGQVDGALWGRTGLHTGPVQFRVESLDGPPASVAEWDEVVEVSFRAPESATLGAFEEFHELPQWPTAPCLRARLHGRAMDDASDADSLDHDADPIDSYLLLVWPEDAPRADETLRRSSRIAEHWHGTTGL